MRTHTIAAIPGEVNAVPIATFRTAAMMLEHLDEVTRALCQFLRQ